MSTLILPYLSLFVSFGYCHDCSFTRRLRHDKVIHHYYPSYQISEQTSLRKLRDPSVQTNKDEVTLRTSNKVVSFYRNCFAESEEREHFGYLAT